MIKPFSERDVQAFLLCPTLPLLGEAAQYKELRLWRQQTEIEILAPPLDFLFCKMGIIMSTSVSCWENLKKCKKTLRSLVWSRGFLEGRWIQKGFLLVEELLGACPRGHGAQGFEEKQKRNLLLT